MKLLYIQNKVAETLRSIDALAGVPVVVEDKGDVRALPISPSTTRGSILL